MSEHHDDADHGSNGAMAGDPMVGVIADVVTAFAPHVTPEMAASIATQVLLEQQGIARVIEDAIPTSENAQKFPVWGFRVITQDGKAGLVKAPKTLHGTAIGDVIQSISVFAILTSPPARAVLYSYGYRVEFVQAPGAQEQRIIMPGQ